MKVELSFPALDAGGRAYLSWRPVPVQVRVVDAPNGAGPIPVRLGNRSNVGGGAVLLAQTLTHNGSDSIDLELPTDGQAVEIWIGGKFGSPSTAFGDVSIEASLLVEGEPTGPSLGRFLTMVRVRKNAEALTNAERDRFLGAMATLNGKGVGRFADFRNMHDNDAYDQIHVNMSFLPWHRAYLLDIERELQLIDPEVSLPYWKFDEAAPKLFQPGFIGRSNAVGAVSFASSNPLRTWSADGTVPGVFRGNGVSPTTVLRVRNEFACMRLSEGPNANFPEFCDWRHQGGQPTGLESDPHNGAHGGHVTGWITNPTTSQFDPLFYLLHANVDRLWAKWQWLPAGSGGVRSDPATAASYYTAADLPNGHNRGDTLWPWDGVTHGQIGTRPPTAPGGGLAPSAMTAAPGPTPAVSDMIDYLGAHGGDHLGFAYDDVPFEL